ncbi:MAG: hypothetical protein HY718_14230 [Planctomycetes bacterium]|nr:hypothetical protein [Planctomycetota bacterium]
MPSAARSFGFSCRRAVTLSETLVAGALVGLLVVVVAIGMDAMRTELKRRQAIALLAALDEALTAYHQATAQWPPDHALPPTPGRPGPAIDPDDDGSGDRIIVVLAAVAESRAVLQRVPNILRLPGEGGGSSTEAGRDARPPNLRVPGEGGGSATRPGGANWGTVVDPWGRRLRCLTATSPSATHRKAVAANRNRPIFISAGPDGRFGFTDVSAASDNLRSDEPSR